MLRRISAQEVTWWQAYEDVYGPIGCGPIIRAIAWLGWLQCDTEVAKPNQVLEWLLAFVNHPQQESVDEAEESQEESQDTLSPLERKMLSMFPQPKDDDGDHRQTQRDPGPE